MVLDGKSLKKQIILELAEEVNKLNSKPGLVVIQVGNDEASNVYIKQKSNMARDIGYNYQHIKLQEDVTMDYLLELIDKLNQDKDVSGIMVQMPLPDTLDATEIQNRIAPDKDVDGLSDVNMGRLSHDREGLYSCTPYGVMELFKHYDISLSGKNAVVIGRSILVGKPMAAFLINAGVTVTICNSKTVNLEKYTKEADILIVAVGKPKLIKASMVKEGAVVIDVGINRVDDTLCGDVDYEEVCKKASFITPVPGGVGPMTVAMLGKNVLKAYWLQNR